MKQTQALGWKHVVVTDIQEFKKAAQGQCEHNSHKCAGMDLYTK